MKRLNTLLSLLFFALIFFCIISIFKFGDFRQNKNLENIENNKTSEKLNKCFDLDNKNSRTIRESLDLIQYCLEKYGDI